MSCDNTVFDFDSLIDLAARDYLLRRTEVFLFPVRKKKGVDNFYEKLDKELIRHAVFKVQDFRSVREGSVSMPRPAKIKLELNDLLRLRPELNQQAKLIDLVTTRCVLFSFNDFFAENYSLVILSLEELIACLEIFHFTESHRQEISGLQIRQIPHGQSTKLIGKSRLLLAIYRFYKQNNQLQWNDYYIDYQLNFENLEFRFFAPYLSLNQQNILGGVHGVLASSFTQNWQFSLKGTIIVENYQTFLYLTNIVQHHLVIWGQGWKVVQLFTVNNIFPAPYYYWGDIDREGIEIYNLLLQKSGMDITPLLMDLETLIKNVHLAQTVEARPEYNKSMTVLNDVYQKVTRDHLRIEQEQIPWPTEWNNY